MTQQLLGPLHRAIVENKLLKVQNKGLLASLNIQNKRTTNGQRLPFPNKKKRATNAKIFTPAEVQVAREIRLRKDKDKKAETKRKADKKEANKQKREVKEKQAEDARIERDRIKRVKEKEKAEHAAEAAQKKAEREARNRKKALQIAQKGKRKASKPLPKQPKRQKKVGAAVGSGVAHRASSNLPPKQSRGSQNIITPAKFK